MLCWHVTRVLSTTLTSSLLLGLLAGSCGGARHEIDEHSSLVILYPGGDEWAVGPAFDAEVHFLVFLPFTAINEKGEVEGRLAESWEHSPDYRTWTIHLRKDVRWHDGTPVTARDVEFTVNLWKHPEVMHPSGLRIESLVVHDEKTLTLTYKRFDLFEAPCLPGCWYVYYPKHLLENLDPAEFYEWSFWLEPIGNGPYRFARYEPTALIELQANPDYYRGKPAIDRLILKFGSAESAVPELLASNVGAVNYAQNAAIMLRDDPRFNIYTELWDDIGALQCIFWNQKTTSLFRDVRIRQALTLAIDRQELRTAIYMSGDVPIVDGVFTGHQFRRGELPEALPHDPASARHLLPDAGWEDTDGDGIRDRDGAPFRFELISSPEWSRAAIYTQDYLREIGVQAELLTLDQTVVRQRLTAGEFEAAIGYVWADPGPGITGPRRFSRFLTDESVIGFGDERAAELLALANERMDPDTLDAVYVELSEILREQLPWTYLTLNVETYIAHRSVRGLSSPYRANPVWSAEHLSIEDEASWR